jgi:hypothetical protein
MVFPAATIDEAIVQYRALLLFSGISLLSDKRVRPDYKRIITKKCY